MPGFNAFSQDTAKFIVDDLDYILSNAKSYTASGKQPKNIFTSKARLPEITLDQSVMADKPKTALNRPINEPSSLARTTVNDLVKARQAAHINELLSSISLDLEDIPKEPRTAGNLSRLKTNVSNVAQKLLGILQVGLYSGDLNEDEKRKLFERDAYNAKVPTVDK